MNFGERIKKVRKDKNLTQQEMADKLNISRQAVSNWENDKNLPDIEMLITMSQVFRLTLDELILGGNQMNNMTEKLIKDGSETARIKMNLMGIKIGGALMVLGFISLIIAIWAPISMEGYLGMTCSFMLLCGVITFLVVGLKNMADLFRKRAMDSGHIRITAVGGLLVLAGSVIYVVSLLTEKVSAHLGFAGIGIGILLILIGVLTAKSNRK